MVAGLVWGCGKVEIEPDDRGQAPARGAGKADHTNSCKDRCGGMAPAGCWCDEACSKPENNDCCADKAQYCDGAPGSCKGHCGGQSPSGCWCDAACAQHGDCCLDKAQECNGTTTSCTKNADCQSGEYCHFKDGDCLSPTMNILTGTCKTVPQACYFLYDPVCGCDGKDYANDCLAHKAGTSVGKKGKCAPPPPPPGCSSNSDCQSGEYCHRDPGKCSATGTCKTIPQQCYEIYAPVCGCDGKDYGNDCKANGAGTSVAKNGECTTTTSCDPMDAGGVGMCAMFIGYKWDGSACVGFSGCSCVGADCSKVFQTKNACEQAYSHCQSSCAGAYVDPSGKCRGSGSATLPQSCCENMCQTINQKYKTAVQAAKKCSPFVTAMQCYTKVDHDLMCPCETTINHPATYTPVAQPAQEFKQKGCYNLLSPCPAISCPVVTVGNCDVSTSTCKD
jgi:hypothetical protein